MDLKVNFQIFQLIRYLAREKKNYNSDDGDSDAEAAGSGPAPAAPRLVEAAGEAGSVKLTLEHLLSSCAAYLSSCSLLGGTLLPTPPLPNSSSSVQTL